jgi:hypothetical protein
MEQTTGWRISGIGTYRFSRITLAVVMLIARDKPAWLVGTYRFIEVSVGISVGLLATALWPESKPAADRRPAT